MCGSDFRAVLGSAGVGITAAYFNCRIMQVDQALCTMLGYEPGELTGKTFAGITYPVNMTSKQKFCRTAIASEKLYYRPEKRYPTEDSAAIGTQVTLTANVSANVKFMYLTAVVEGITARREADAALQTSESQLADA